MKYKLEKIYAWIKWIGAILLVDVIMRILCVVFYPLAYVLRVKVREWHNNTNKIKFVLSLPLWVLLNDGKSNDVGYLWFWNAKGIQPTTKWNRFKLAYLWNPLRNPCWNIYEYICPNEGEKTDIDEVDRYGYGSCIQCMPSQFDFCVLKWKDSEGNESNNIGETIDYKKSILGMNFVYYRVNNVLYFRYSYAWVRGNKAREVQLGSGNSRFKIRNKLKFLK